MREDCNLNETSNGLKENENVTVCIRIRSLIAREINENVAVTIQKSTKHPTELTVGNNKTFTFDHVFGMDSTQEEIYKLCVEDLVEKFIEGYNATVFAYGQTSTGKTYTMGGCAKTSPFISEKDGIIPRVVSHVFQSIEQSQEEYTCSVKVEYLEIYLEQLRDLLCPETPSKNINIRENLGEILVTGNCCVPVANIDDIVKIIKKGESSRSTGNTLMNEYSSRSHAIFTLMMSRKNLSTGETTQAKLHLVDLAGSERAKQTGAEGDRFKESVNINQGLLALGNVISALTEDGKGRKTHIPYRESKLTRLLQDSLGGNSRTVMIACISPALSNVEETLNTLKYASRAKYIRNRATINHVMADTVLQLDNRQITVEDVKLMEQELLMYKETTGRFTQNKSFLEIKQRAQSLIDDSELFDDKTPPSLQLLDKIRKLLYDIASLNIGNESDNIPDPPGNLHLQIDSLSKQLRDAKNDIACDEEIFTQKNKEIQELKELLIEAKDRNEQLISSITSMKSPVSDTKEDACIQTDTEVIGEKKENAWPAGQVQITRPTLDYEMEDDDGTVITAAGGDTVPKYRQVRGSLSIETSPLSWARPRMRFQNASPKKGSYSPKTFRKTASKDNTIEEKDTSHPISSLSNKKEMEMLSSAFEAKLKEIVDDEVVGAHRLVGLVQDTNNLFGSTPTPADFVLRELCKIEDSRTYYILRHAVNQLFRSRLEEISRSEKLREADDIIEKNKTFIEQLKAGLNVARKEFDERLKRQTAEFTRLEEENKRAKEKQEEEAFNKIKEYQKYMLYYKTKYELTDYENQELMRQSMQTTDKDDMTVYLQKQNRELRKELAKVKTVLNS